MKRYAALAVGVAALVVCVPAYAMPQAIAGVLIWAGVSAAVSWVVAYGITIVAMGLYAKRQRRKAIDAYNKSLRDRVVMVRGGIEPRELVLGRVRKSGTIAFMGSTGEDKAVLYVVIALAGHACDAIEQVYFNELPVTLDENGYVTDAPYALTKKESGSKTIQMINGVGSVELDHDPIGGRINVTYFDTGSGDSYGGSVSANASLSGRTVTATFDSTPLNTMTVSALVTYQHYVLKPKARVWWYLGSDDQLADDRLKTAFPGVWTDAHRGRGITYLVAELQYHEDAFPSGVPNISARIRGAKCFDQRNSTTAWSDNPALLARYYATHPLGGRQPAARISDAHEVAAANVCDQVVSYPMSSGTVSRKLYTAGTVAVSGQRPKDVLDDLAEAMGGKIAFSGNQIVMKAGAYVAPVLALTDDDIGDVSQVNIQPRRPRQEAVNTISGTFVDEEHDYLPVNFEPVDPPEYLAADGAVLPADVELNAVTHAGQAQHVVGIMLRDARQALTLQAPFRMRAYPVQIFDVVTLTSSRLGFVNKEFEVVDRRWSLEGLVKLTLKETGASIWQFGAAFSAVDVLPNTMLPRPWVVADIADLAVESGTDWLVRQSDGTLLTRARVTWTQTTDAPVKEGGRIEVSYKAADDAAADDAWSTVMVPGASTEAFILGLRDGRRYLFRVRGHSALAAGDWSLHVAHTVLGKSQAPSNVPWALISGNTITWGAVTDVDLAGYRLRYVSGALVNWAGGLPLHKGLVTVTNFDFVTRPAGVTTILIKAVDTSGNESDAPAVIVTDLGDPETLNVLESWPQAPTFGGTISGGTVSAGVLEANVTSLFWTNDSALHWGAASLLYWPTTSYGALTYACAFTTTSEGTLSLESAIEGEDILIEYQRESQSLYWGAGDAYFWSTDGGALAWAPGSGWQPWPGNVVLAEGEPIGMRVTTGAGIVRGRITTLTPHLDVPDIEERLDDIVIAPGGTRLPVTLPFRVITNLQLTIQADGNGGTSARILDKQVSPGPLVEVLNDAATSVAGLVDARIKGY